MTPAATEPSRLPGATIAAVSMATARVAPAKTMVRPAACAAVAIAVSTSAPPSRSWRKRETISRA